MKTFEMKTVIHFGDNALDRLAELPYKKVLVITDPFIAKGKMIELITDPLRRGGKEFEVFSDVVPDAPVGKIAEVVNDTDNHVKYPLISDSLTADEAILDAELVKSVPPSITADTGMDVLTHAIESYVSINHNEFSSALAEKSIEICGVFLLRAYLDGGDMHARQKMHVASCLAGLSFNAAGLGITHSMAHQLGAIFHIPHGRANAMLLPHIVEFNANINKHSRSQQEYLPAVKRYANISHILGLSNYNKVMSVRSLVNWIQFMQKEMNIPLTIKEMGTISEDEYFAAIDKMANLALADACTTANPRVPTKEDIVKIYKKLWSF